MVSYHPLVTRCIHRDCWEETPPGTNGQLDPKGGFLLMAGGGEGLRCTMEPSEAQEPAREGGHCSSDYKNLGSNSGLHQEA
jgi:hypothetical protein